MSMCDCSDTLLINQMKPLSDFNFKVVSMKLL